MKQFFAFFLTLCLAFGRGYAVFAQTIVFPNPNFPVPPNAVTAANDFTVDNVRVGSGSTVSVTSAARTVRYSVTVYRPTGNVSEGVVNIYAGDANGNLASNPLTSFTGSAQTNIGGVWVNNGVDGSGKSWEYRSLNGSFDLSTAAMGNFTTLYAVVALANSTTTRLNISPGILTNNPGGTGGGTTPPPTQPSGPTTLCIIQGNSFIINGEQAAGTWPNDKYRYLYQVSRDGVNWSDFAVSDAFEANTRPPAGKGAIQVRDIYYSPTYYRVQLQTKTEGLAAGFLCFWWCGWEVVFTSSTITVNVQSIPPLPIETTVNTSVCSTVGQARLAVAQNPHARSYNWWVPYAGWTITDGVAPATAAPNSANSFTTTRTALTVNIPAGTPPGTYPVYVSSTGSCGPKSADAVINVVVNNSPPVANAPSLILNPQTSNCFNYWDFTAPLSVGASNYSLNVVSPAYSFTVGGLVNPSAGVVTFPTQLFGTNEFVTATLTVSSACGTATTGPQSYYLSAPGPGCQGDQYQIAAYPNPAANQLTVSSGGQEAQATIYDHLGAVRRTVRLAAQQAATDINTADLPSGTYLIRLVSDGKVMLRKQIIIQH